MKKRLSLVLLIYCCLSSFSQKPQFDDSLDIDPLYENFSNKQLDTTYGFNLVDGEVIWQNIFSTDKSAKEISEYFTRVRKFDIVENDSATIYGKVERQNINYEKLGFKRMSVAMFVNCPTSYKIIIDIKNERYRVTISEVVFAATMGLTAISPNSNSLITLAELCYNH